MTLLLLLPSYGKPGCYESGNASASGQVALGIVLLLALVLLVAFSIWWRRQVRPKGSREEAESPSADSGAAGPKGS